MLTEDGKHLYVSYDEYHNLIEKLAIKVHQSGWEFDTILCLARAACARATSCRASLTSRWPSCPPAPTALMPARCRATWTSRATSPRPKGEIAGKVLLVDDLADSGHTLNVVIQLLRNNYKPITELRSAVIWTKAMSSSRRLLGGVPADQPLDPPALRRLRRMRPEQLIQKWSV
jgi:orotate phosphoribosyltransferase